MVRVQVARKGNVFDYWLRTAASGIDYAGDAIGPHADTDRVTSTVPTSMKYLITRTSSQIIRDGAPTTPGIAEVWVHVSGIYLHRLAILSTNVGDSEHDAAGEGGTAQEGDALIITTTDPSTGGTHAYRANASFVRFPEV